MQARKRSQEFADAPFHIVPSSIFTILHGVCSQFYQYFTSSSTEITLYRLMHRVPLVTSTGLHIHVGITSEKETIFRILLSK